MRVYITEYLHRQQIDDNKTHLLLLMLLMLLMRLLLMLLASIFICFNFRIQEAYRT